MTDLILISGPPGAGKSTVAALVADSYSPAVLVPGDAFFSFWVRGAIPPWLPEAHEQNQVSLRAAAAAAGAFRSADTTVIYEGVVGPWFLPAFVRDAGVAQLHYAMLLPTLDQCLTRVAMRSGHGFTDPEATRHMYDDFAAAPIDDRHVLRDPPDDPVEVAADLVRLVGEQQLLYRR